MIAQVMPSPACCSGVPVESPKMFTNSVEPSGLKQTPASSLPL